MYGMNYSGGRNRTHGTIEKCERIDSFDVAKLGGWGTLFAYTDKNARLIDFDRSTEYGSTPEADREIVELWAGTWSQTIWLTRTPSGFGGHCTFWLCPRCGRRSRYLYFNGRGFVCRGCAKLNYRCQQRTNDSTNYAHDGLKLAREKLRWEPPLPVCPEDFPHVVPDRPKGMHKRTYYRYLARYRRYQKKYRDESTAEMLRIIGFALGPDALREIGRLQYDDS